MRTTAVKPKISCSSPAGKTFSDWLNQRLAARLFQPAKAAKFKAWTGDEVDFELAIQAGQPAMMWLFLHDVFVMATDFSTAQSAAELAAHMQAHTLSGCQHTPDKMRSLLTIIGVQS